MAAVSDTILDSGLDGGPTLTETIHILSADPGLTWASIGTNTLGNKSSPTITAVADRSGGGRKFGLGAITDGSVTATGDATHWAITDDSATEVLASGALSGTVAVTSGGTWTCSAVTVLFGVADPS